MAFSFHQTRRRLNPFSSLFARKTRTAWKAWTRSPTFSLSGAHRLISASMRIGSPPLTSIVRRRAARLVRHVEKRREERRGRCGVAAGCSSFCWSLLGVHRRVCPLCLVLVTHKDALFRPSIDQSYLSDMRSCLYHCALLFKWSGWWFVSLPFVCYLSFAYLSLSLFRRLFFVHFL